MKRTAVLFLLIATACTSSSVTSAAITASPSPSPLVAYTPPIPINESPIPPTKASPLTKAPSPVPIGATYMVLGTAKNASLTFTTATGDTAQIASVKVPWQYRAFDPSSGLFLYISAQNLSQSGGTITCQIWLFGVVVKTTTSRGFASICEASWLMP